MWSAAIENPKMWELFWKQVASFEESVCEGLKCLEHIFSRDMECEGTTSGASEGSGE